MQVPTVLLEVVKFQSKRCDSHLVREESKSQGFDSMRHYYYYWVLGQVTSLPLYMNVVGWKERPIPHFLENEHLGKKNRGLKHCYFENYDLK